MSCFCKMLSLFATFPLCPIQSRYESLMDSPTETWFFSSSCNSSCPQLQRSRMCWLRWWPTPLNKGSCSLEGNATECSDYNKTPMQGAAMGPSSNPGSLNLGSLRLVMFGEMIGISEASAHTLASWVTMEAHNQVQGLCKTP